MSLPDLDVLDYDNLVRDYRAGLIDRLRGFSVAHAFLELWVPDDDLHRSLINLVQAAREANRDALELRLGPDTAEGLDQERLQSALTHPAKFTLIRDAAGRAVLKFAGIMGQGSVAGAGLTDAVGPQATRRSAEIAAIVAAAGAYRPPTLVEPREIASDYRAAALAAASRTREAVAPSARDGLVAAEGVLGNVRLRLLASPTTQLISSAGFTGVADDISRGLLEALSELAPGLTVHELADHGAIHLETALRDPALTKAHSGIRLARAADPAFRWIEALTRAALADWRAKTGYSASANEFDFSPRPQWLAAEDTSRLAWLSKAIAEIGQSERLDVSGIVINRIEYNVRVVLNLPGGMARRTKEHLLLCLERGIKSRVDPRLEVFSEELKDKNVLRRLK